MAERRISNRDAIATARRVTLLFETLAPETVRTWFVQDAANVVLQPFYAAVDRDSRVCWTDDCDRAKHFRSKQDAERFVVDRLTMEARVVPHR